MLWIEKLKSLYPNGTKVELVRAKSNSSSKVPVGTQGIVGGIDDGVVTVTWDNGMQTSVFIEIGDSIRKVG